jgi:hypothetical protein
MLETGRCLRDLAYARLGASYSGVLNPAGEADVERPFREIVDWEAAEGTPLETILARLPPGLALELRRALSDALAAKVRGRTLP